MALERLRTCAPRRVHYRLLSYPARLFRSKLLADKRINGTKQKSRYIGLKGSIFDCMPVVEGKPNSVGDQGS